MYPKICCILADMQITKTTQAANRAEWRAWLEKHHSTESEVWLVYTRKGSDKPSVTYPESLEEALCFGWIDSLIQKIDDEKYARKFNPRRVGSKWSDLNKHLVAKLIKEKRMTEAGLAPVDFSLPEVDAPRLGRPEITLPEWLKEGLMVNPIAWKNFNHFPASHRRAYIAWISDAKKEETRQRRIREAIEMLEKNERLGLK
jgi:uncharacterized protein YdeI (YjbR/CyaY-like superfamily)